MLIKYTGKYVKIYFIIKIIFFFFAYLVFWFFRSKKTAAATIIGKKMKSSAKPQSSTESEKIDSICIITNTFYEKKLRKLENDKVNILSICIFINL